MDRYEKRVLRLREHVLSHSSNGAAESNYNDLTKAEIAESLDEKGIDYNSRDTKKELYELLSGSD